MQRSEPKLFKSYFGGVEFVEVVRDIEAVVVAFLLEEASASDDSEVVERDGVQEIGEDKHISSHFANIFEKRQVGGQVGDEDQLQVAIDVGAVAVGLPHALVCVLANVVR